MTKLALIALDGPSGVGKSTTAKRVAQELQWSYLDTGAMFRCTALAILRAGIEVKPSPELDRLLSNLKLEQHQNRFFLNGEDVSEAIREKQVTQCVSQVSALAAVRATLLEQQRTLGQRGGWVVDGRDIGTVVFPTACCKIFLTASAEARAKRRFLELQTKGGTQTFEEILQDQLARDHADSTRAVAPLRKAPDATELDSSDMTLEDVVAKIVAHHKQHG